jgi:hypothetical protein
MTIRNSSSLESSQMLFDITETNLSTWESARDELVVGRLLFS